MSDHDSHSHAAHGPVTRPGDITAHDDHGHGHHAHDSHGHDSHAHGDGGHGGLGKYLLVFLALCGLTTMSFLTYSSAWPWPLSRFVRP